MIVRTYRYFRVVAATEFRNRVRAHMREIVPPGVAMLLPSAPDVAPLCDLPQLALSDHRARALGMLAIAGLAGAPQLSLPMLQGAGGPIGLSLLGARGSDRDLFDLAEQIVPATGARA